MSYAESALEHACSSVANAIESSRNMTLNRESFGIGRLVGAGALDGSAAEARLLQAASLLDGFPMREAVSTIRRGLSNGADDPADLLRCEACQSAFPRPGSGERERRFCCRSCENGHPQPTATVAAPTTPPAAIRAPRPLRRPPQDEVAHVWEASTCIADDGAIVAWLTAPRPEGRGWPRRIVDAIADQDLARALTKGPLPSWASIGSSPERVRSWAQSQHRLVVPVFNAKGTARSIKARRITQHGSSRLKSLCPWSGFAHDGTRREPFQVKHLFFANSDALTLLEGSGRELVIVEGEMDFLARAAVLGSPVIGIFAGSWCPELAARIPNATTVHLDTDHDLAGDQYARKINRTVQHCLVFRSPAVCERTE